MSTPILDPSLPADNPPLSSGEMRGQFQAIQNNFDDLRARVIALTPLGLTVSNPPTQAEEVTGASAILIMTEFSLLREVSRTPRTLKTRGSHPKPPQSHIVGIY